MKHARKFFPPLARCAEVLLWIAGALSVAYCTYTLIEAKITQSRLSRLLDHDRQVRHSDSTVQSNAEQLKHDPMKTGSKSDHNLVGRLLIPKLGLSAIVLEGDDARTLRLGLGHIPGTSRPGQSGNVGIAGHRDTFLLPLRHIQKADQIVLETAASTYRYRVTSIKIVDPKDVSALESKKNHELTLVTCYPFTYVGAAPRRFIVHAEAEP